MKFMFSTAYSMGSAEVESVEICLLRLYYFRTVHGRDIVREFFACPPILHPWSGFTSSRVCLFDI